MAGSASRANIASLVGLSVLGRSAATTGVMAAITGTDGQVRRVSGTTLGFGTIVAGAIADDGQLSSPPVHRPLGRVVEEPRLTERMVERCLRTGARVTPVGGAAAAMLADSGGVAARLRW